MPVTLNPRALCLFQTAAPTNRTAGSTHTAVNLPGWRPEFRPLAEVLLAGKVKDWLEQNDLAELWTKAQLPLRVVGGLIVFSLVATLYSGVLSTINSIPLVPGLLELAGVIWLVNFALRNLIRNSDRDNFIKGARSTWTRVTGRSS